jgi:hypothetical protein
MLWKRKVAQDPVNRMARDAREWRGKDAAGS